MPSIIWRVFSNDSEVILEKTDSYIHVILHYQLFLHFKLFLLWQKLNQSGSTFPAAKNAVYSQPVKSCAALILFFLAYFLMRCLSKQQVFMRGHHCVLCVRFVC